MCFYALYFRKAKFHVNLSRMRIFLGLLSFLLLWQPLLALATETEIKAPDFSEITSSENLENPEEPEVVLKGSVNRVLEREEEIKISIMNLFSSEFSKEGDLVEAKILVEPTTQNKDLYALRGSKLIGKVVETRDSGKFGRAGYIKTRFHTLKLSSGSEFPIEAEMISENFKGQEAFKTAWKGIKLVTKGAVWGTFSSLRFAPGFAFSTGGLSLAAGTGIGISMALIGVMRSQGDVKTYLPGQKVDAKFSSPLNLPQEAIEEAKLISSSNQTSELIGLKLEPVKSTLVSSKEFDQLISVKIKITNNTSSMVCASDIILLPKNGADPLIADLRHSREELLKLVKSGEESVITLLYPADKDIKISDLSLALIDPLDKKFLTKVNLVTR